MKIRLLLLSFVLGFTANAQTGCPSPLSTTHIPGPDSIENHFDQTFRSLAVNPLDPNHVIMGTEGNGFFVSRDGGLHWKWVRDGLRHFTTSYAESWTTLFNAKDTAVMYAATTGSPGPTQGNSPSSDAGIYKSIDNGQTWYQRNCGLPSSSTNTVWCDKDSTNSLLAGIAGGSPSFTNPVKPFYDGGIYYSTDGAANWMKANTPINVDSITFWKFIKTHDTIITYGLSSDLSKAVGFLKSYDNGRTWQRFIAPLAGKPVVDFTVAPDGLNMVAMIRDSNAVYTSTNGGFSWQRISISVNGVLEFHPYSSDTIFITAANEIYKSKNGIKTGDLSSPDYKRVGIFTHWIEKIVFAPSNPSIMYVSTRGLRVYKSTDGGETFSLLVKLREVMADPIYITHDSLTLGEDSVNSVYGGDTTAVQLTSNTNWMVTSDANWVTVDPMNGDSSHHVLSIVTRENTGTQRTAVVSISAGAISKTIYVIQQSVPASLSLDEDSLISTHDGDTSLITLTSNANWIVSNADNWITVAPMSGSGNQTLSFITTKNTGAVRTATININAGALNKTVYVKQEMDVPYITLAEDSIINIAEGDTSFIQLTSNTNWTVGTLPGWITINPMNGIGNATLGIITQKNTGGERSATININAGSVLKTIYVEQGMSALYLTLAEDSITSVADGDTTSIQLTSNISWTLGTSAGWVTVAPMSGNGDQLLSIKTQKNIGAVRTATVTITAGSITKTIYVKQETLIPFVTIDVAMINSPATGHTTSIALTSNSGWTVSNPVSWVTISPLSGNGNATLSCIVSENIATTDREAIISVTAGASSETFHVHQEGIPTTGLEKVSVSSIFAVYPNPTQGKLTFKNKTLLDSDIEVFDIKGRLVDRFVAKEGEEIIRDYSELNKGLYVLRVKNVEGVSMGRFVVGR
jgi:hypothetical protein